MKPKLAKRLIEPDYWTCPHGKRARPDSMMTYGPEVADVNAAAGFAPDPQQELALDLIFAINPDGTPACFEFCVICCRQNLKTGIFKMTAIGWIYVLDEPDVVWSAHEMSTTLDAQRELADLIRDAPSLRKRMKVQKNDGVYDANGSERIELKDQTIWFKARTRDGARGLARRKLILDEHFATKPAMMGALIPTMLTKRGAQVVAGSSAGKADSDVLLDARDRGRAGSSPRMSYLEWCAEREKCRNALGEEDLECRHPKDAKQRGLDCALDREHLWLKANPTISTGRITVQDLADSRQAMPPEEFARECLGWWDDAGDGAEATFGKGKWEACALEVEPPEHPGAIGVAVSVDGLWSSIAAAAQIPRPGTEPSGEDDDDEVVFITAVDRREDTDWLIDEVKRIQDEHDCIVVMDEKGPAAAMLIEAFDEADIAVETVDLGQYIEACARMFKKVRARNLIHPSSDELDEAVSGAEWRLVGDRRVWGRKASTSDVSMLEAATLAAYGAEEFGIGLY